jgi:integrase
MGELCGLKWDNINLDRGIVKIKQSSWRGELGTPKSKKGVRTFAISPGLWAALREKRAADPVTDSGLVFNTSNDTPWDGDTIRKRKPHPLCDRLGIARGGFHAFRHGKATIMDQVSVPTKVRQDRLGHADIEITMGLHALISEDDPCSCRIRASDLRLEAAANRCASAADQLADRNRNACILFPICSHGHERRERETNTRCCDRITSRGGAVW